jgi:phosphate transport system protein
MATRSALDQDMVAIRDDILRLASLVSRAMERALEALTRHDQDLAQTVVNDDDILDELHSSIEEQVLRTFARQQPVARDLRKLVADLLISNELERMGDHAEGVARAALRYSGDAAIPVPDLVPKMRRKVQDMINDVMDAYVDMNPAKARAVAQDDDEIDHLYQELFNLIINAMRDGEISVEQGTYMLWVGHNFERISDRVTNISERIVYAQDAAIRDLNPKPHERD